MTRRSSAPRPSVVADVRGDPEAVDAPWLTSVLEEAGVARGASVTEVELTGDIGTGQSARTSRFALSWDDPQDRPASLVGKFPSSDAGTRAAAFSAGGYLKEWCFYDRVARTTDVRTPACPVALYDGDTPDFVLLLEDLSHSAQADQIEGLTLEQVVLALEQLVALHASHFGERDLAALLSGGGPVVSADQVAEFLEAIYGASLPAFAQRLGDRIDPEVLELCTELIGSIREVFTGSATPTTIVHLDFRADNLLYGTSADAPPITVVDWQTVSEGLGALDLAYLIGGSFADPAQRAAAEAELVEEYRGRIGSAGIEITADECWRDYRVGSTWGLVITVIATAGAERTERGDDMFSAMAHRHGRHAIDLDALSLLR